VTATEVAVLEVLMEKMAISALVGAVPNCQGPVNQFPLLECHSLLAAKREVHETSKAALMQVRFLVLEEVAFIGVELGFGGIAMSEMK
jgi:hypothetical protein